MDILGLESVGTGGQPGVRTQAVWTPRLARVVTEQQWEKKEWGEDEEEQEQEEKETLFAVLMTVEGTHKESVDGQSMGGGIAGVLGTITTTITMTTSSITNSS